ncbi:MAG: threonylcarbamoyl-AMP synthase [Methanosphaera stadtmanae]|nr:threonylcarbamoyl-AMP synthase [Methanosphaera stadtmanae]
MRVITNPNKNDLKYALNQLKKGNLVVYPTDTIYGIASNIADDKALKKVFEVKNRSLDKPISICLHDFEQLEQVAQMNDKLRDIVHKLLPGPYTLLLRKQKSISPLITSNSDIIGIRIPDSEICFELTKSFPITSTSANLSNKKTPNNIQDIINQLNNDISVYLDVGLIGNNKPSTIIDLTNKKPKIIRNTQKDDKLLNSILKMNLY